MADSGKIETKIVNIGCKTKCNYVHVQANLFMGGSAPLPQASPNCIIVKNVRKALWVGVLEY